MYAENQTLVFGSPGTLGVQVVLPLAFGERTYALVCQIAPRISEYLYSLV